MTVSPLKDGRIRLEGTIDGLQDFQIVLGNLPPGATIDCENVTQINSTGIKAWMRYFCSPQRKGFGLRFENLAIPLVEQLNMFRNFLGEGQVVSLALPFRCELCNLNFSKIFPVGDALQFKAEAARTPCIQCGQPARFDDLTDEYFQFLAR